MMSSIFNQLHPSIQTLLKTKKIIQPTEPQEKAIPPILHHDHVLLIAPTGHGKTEAAILPVFHQFIHWMETKKKEEQQSKGISIIYITPLRALNRDMLRRTISWGKELGINIAVRHGDTTQKERARQSRSPPDMLITTPETLQILFIGKRLRRHLQSVQWVIIDEIHELSHDERGAQLSVGLERLYERTMENDHSFQRIGLSATVGSPDVVAAYLGGKANNAPRPVRVIEVDVSKHMDIHVEIPEVSHRDSVDAASLSIDPHAFAALRICKQQIDTHTSTLVFINTRDGAEIIGSRFHIWKPDFPISVHHGSLAKSLRIEAEDNFKAGRLTALICTSSLELGIDVGQTDFIIQYNSPRDVTRLIQRVGRSGHKIGETSKGIILSTNPEDLAESLVIAQKTLKGMLEPIAVRDNPLSVLCNQIISITLEYGRIKKETVYQIVQRAYPFKNLSADAFQRIVQQLGDQRSIWIEDEYIGKRRRSRTYFLDNISMIPDEKTYMAVDMTTRKNIGKLDESFVLNAAFEGTQIILRGRPWLIIKREEDSILMTQSKEIGNVPSWVGEDIPIPFMIAQEVGKLRRLIDEKKRVDYPSNQQTLSHLIAYINKQKKEGFQVPTDKKITLEVSDRLLIINVCGGTKVNETIGRIISAMLAQTLGESVGITSDAYRIQLEFPRRIDPQRIKELILSIDPQTIPYLLRRIIKNSTYIRWQLVHAARKFGSLRKDFDVKHVGLKKLFSLFDDTLIFEEAVEKLLYERMDIKHTQIILSQIQQEKIAMIVQRISPIGFGGSETMRGLMVPLRADRTILMALKKRLFDVRITFKCVNCKKQWHSSVERSPNRPQCPRCQAIKIAVLPSYREKEFKTLEKKPTGSKEQQEYQRFHKNASLVTSYGKLAIIALMGRGIGPDTAARILRFHDPFEVYKSEEAELHFLRDIHKAEIHYAKTRGFWDT